MAIEVKDIKDLVSEYVSEIGNMDKASMHKLWTEAAGKELTGITEFIKEENGRIVLLAKNPAAYSLLMLKKRKILDAYRKAFPEFSIRSMQIKRTY